ncbi:hypothetical protein PRUPE_7G192700 [Prunus persica]|uniref:Uncharacterized protein n=1 Tax=Prunus persica TaxID=3760 RepID=A0A251NDX7_PRUPE|nr:hypothetical protein PRUPE_7G192700 [Prunus persica]ONH97496.1 hypothetical protein PRUPE_7G192700 [Prunus persica]
MILTAWLFNGTLPCVLSCPLALYRANPTYPLSTKFALGRPDLETKIPCITWRVVRGWSVLRPNPILTTHSHVGWSLAPDSGGGFGQNDINTLVCMISCPVTK